MNITVSENIKQRFENIKLWLADIMMAHSIKYGQVPDIEMMLHTTQHTQQAQRVNDRFDVCIM